MYRYVVIRDNTIRNLDHMSVNQRTPAKREILVKFSVPHSTYLCTSRFGTQIWLRISSFFWGSGNFEGIPFNRSFRIAVFFGIFAILTLANFNFAFAATDLPNPADIGLPFQGG